MILLSKTTLRDVTWHGMTNCVLPDIELCVLLPSEGSGARSREEESEEEEEEEDDEEEGAQVMSVRA